MLARTNSIATSNQYLQTYIFLCLALALRPASIWLLPVVILTSALGLFYKRVGLITLFNALTVAATPLYIQAALNSINYKLTTFLPVTNLGALQISGGIQYIKYGTWLGGGPPQNYYTSANLISTSSNLSLSWYFNNPIDSIKLMAVKLIGAFDFDYLVAYHA
jgi:hypothetical protein